MDNQQENYDENIAQEAGYTAGRFGKLTHQANLNIFIPNAFNRGRIRTS